jgi:hypothetical protein
MAEPVKGVSPGTGAEVGVRYRQHLGPVLWHGHGAHAC